MSTCDICDESYNKSNRKKVTCSYCSESACTACTQRFLTEMTTGAECMFCKKAWSREMIDSHFTKTWIKNTYTKRREGILVEREKSMLPSTQHLVENELKRRALSTEMDALTLEIRVLKQKLYEKQQSLNAKKRERYVLENAPETGQEKRVFTRACPADGCRGFLSTQWKCGICSTSVCAKCHEIKYGEREHGEHAHGEREHVCNPEILASVQAMAHDTKPCPKCSALIYKVSGCDQMWCTACKTAFSWRTGRVVTSQIHNPHFIAWQAQHADAGGEDRCGNNREMPSMSQKLKKELTPAVFQHLQQIRRALIHKFDVDMHRLTFGEHIEQNNIDLRIRYMLHEIGEEEWKVLLQRREKRAAKETDLRMLCEMLYESGRDIFRRMMKGFRNEHVEELEALREYYNAELLKIASRYACKVHPLNENWDV